jgi:hypothetical protein
MYGNYHLCTFKDGFMDWVGLKELKELNPIKVAKFAVANHLSEEHLTSGRYKRCCGNGTGVFQR